MTQEKSLVAPACTGTTVRRQELLDTRVMAPNLGNRGCHRSDQEGVI